MPQAERAAARAASMWLRASWYGIMVEAVQWRAGRRTVRNAQAVRSRAPFTAGVLRRRLHCLAPVTQFYTS